MASKENWLKVPDSQGYWWHWDENSDSRPFIYHVQVSKTGADRYFIESPDSRWCDEVGGLWIKAEEPRAWQNAAESLPSQPNFMPCVDCGQPLIGCNCPLPAPVEAKDKPCPRCGSTSKHMTKAGWRCLDRWHYETEEVVEPKPTPSGDAKQMLTCPHGVGRCVCRICNGINWGGKPPPDSSSIPDGQTFESKFMDAQYKTVEYNTAWQAALELDEENEYAFRAGFDAAWAAAKGHSNGR